MSSVSRQSFEQISHVCCSAAHPWNKRCVKGCMQMLFTAGKGSALYYLPMFIGQHFINNNKITADYAKETLIKYVREILFGGFMGAGFVGTVCLFRNIFKRHGYYTVSLIPAAVGGIAIFFVHPTRRGIAVTTFQALVFEALYKYLQQKGIFKKTTIFDTFFFMLCSSGLLYLIRSRKNSKTFLWFFSPKEMNATTQEKYNSGPSWKYIISASKKYFLLGYILQVVKEIIIFIKRKDSLSTSSLLFKLLFSLNTYLLGLFTGGYVLIYEAMVYFLRHWYKYDAAIFAIPAGFIAGVTFSILPNLTITAVALANLVKIALECINEKVKLPQFPWKEISFILNSGIIFHVRTMHPQICPKSAINVMNTMTDGRADIIYYKFLEYIDKCKKL